MASKGGNSGAGGDGKDVDPRLLALAQQLAGEASRKSYTERRLEELERRAAAKAAGTAKGTRPATAASSAPTAGPTTPARAGEDWRDAMSPRLATEAVPPPPPSAAEPTLDSLKAAAREANLGRPRADAPPDDGRHGFDAAPWVRTLLSAWFVFGIAAAAQGAFMGYTASLGWRSFAAATGAACSWRWLGPGRFRTALVGVTCHMVAFVDVAQVASRTVLFAIYFAAMLVLFGSGVIGLIREQRAFRI